MFAFQTGTKEKRIFGLYLGFGLILVFVEIQGFGPEDEPAELPVLHDAPLSLQPAALQSFLLIQRRTGPGDAGELSQHHAL